MQVAQQSGDEKSKKVMVRERNSNNIVKDVRGTIRSKEQDHNSNYLQLDSNLHLDSVVIVTKVGNYYSVVIVTKLGNYYRD